MFSGLANISLFGQFLLISRKLGDYSNFPSYMMCEHSPSLLGNRSWNKVNNIVDCNNVEHEVQRKPLIGPKALPILTYVLSIKEQNNFIALLDTGAQKSYINSDTANKLQKKYPEAYSIVPVKEQITSKMGNGSISPI